MVGAVGPSVYSSLAWRTSLSPPGAGLLFSPLLPGPSDRKWRTTIKERDGMERLPPAERGKGQWHPFTPLPSQGLSLSSVWMGALSLGAQHDERPWLRCRLCLSCLHLGQW